MPASPRSPSRIRSRSGPSAPVPVKTVRAPRNGRPKQQRSQLSALAAFTRRCADPTDTRAGCVVAAAVLVGEALLTALIIRRVPYTEIDWTTYMAQLAVIDKGEFDYARVSGPTGPLVYPAGHVWLHRALRALTGGGAIPPAQWVAAGLYLASQALALGLTIASRGVPPAALPLLAASKRLHSIYVLRLFNDCWSATLAYAATALLLTGRTALSILTFSAAVSVKMSALLFGPPVLLACLRWGSPRAVGAGVLTGAALQVALAAPFLAAAPWSYASRAFELSRAFLYKWTVNLRFLPESAFSSPALAAGLLATHGALLAAFASTRWVAGEPGGLAGVLSRFWVRARAPTPARTGPRTTAGGRKLAPGRAGMGGGGGRGGARPPPGPALALLASGNLAGIAASRSLHYQFYAWYAQTLPLLLWAVDVEGLMRGRSGRRPTAALRWAAAAARLCAWAVVEAAWNTFPATPASSAGLTAVHVLLVVGLLVRPARWTGMVGP